MINEEIKILTSNLVKKLGLDKASAITADMLDGYTSIAGCAFMGCSNLTSVIIPNSITSIGVWAFARCSNLISVNIPDSVTNIGNSAFYGCNFKEKKKTDKQGRIIAYKGFNADLTCKDFQYEEGKTYKIDGDTIICVRGFHACLNPLDCFEYYWGKIGKDVVFHEVYLEDMSDEKYGDDSKVVARKITIGREISLSEMANIASERKFS